MKKAVKFGLIGCGRISYKHFESIKQIENAVIIACSDKNEERARENATKYDIPKYYVNYLEMLDKEKLDAVLICTPSGLHAEMGIESARRGIHVVTEKPMATKLSDADELIKECDKHNVHLHVVKQNRLNTTMQLLKKAIDKGRFGKIYMVQSNVFWQRPQEYYDSAKWRGTWEFDGGAFMNQASHYVDAIHWLIGPVDHIMAETATMARNIETEDTGSAIIKFRNGVIGTMSVTMLTFPKNYEGSITILGEKGTVKIGGVAVNAIEKWEFDSYDDDDKIITETNYNPPNIYGFGHLPYLTKVVESIYEKKPPMTDGRDGRKSLEMIQAMYLSAKSGKKVAIPIIT